MSAVTLPRYMIRKDRFNTFMVWDRETKSVALLNRGKAVRLEMEVAAAILKESLQFAEAEDSFLAKNPPTSVPVV